MPETEARAELRQYRGVAGEHDRHRRPLDLELEADERREAADRSCLGIAQQHDRILRLEVANELVPVDAEEEPAQDAEAGTAVLLAAVGDRTGLVTDEHDLRARTQSARREPPAHHRTAPAQEKAPFLRRRKQC